MNKFNFYSVSQGLIGVQSLAEHIDIFVSGYDVLGLMLELKNETIWGKYLVGCLNTWNVRDVPLLQIPNAALGLIGEILEYRKTPTIDELGDIIYYRAILRYLVGDKIEIYSTKSIDSFDYFEVIELITDFSKKAVYHDKMFDIKTRNKYEDAFAMLDAFLWYQIIYIHKLQSFEPVLEFNLDKLAKRHNKGFSPNYDSQATN